MLIPSSPKKEARQQPSATQTVDPSNDLRFISDLGRSLLFTVHPKKVASRVADAIRHALDAEICVFAAELRNIGVISCAVNRDGELTSDFLEKAAFDKWLDFMPPQIVILRSAPGASAAWCQQLFQHYWPGTLILALEGELVGLPETLTKPYTQNVTAWVCQGVQCLPVIDDCQKLINVCKSGETD